MPGFLFVDYFVVVVVVVGGLACVGPSEGECVAVVLAEAEGFGRVRGRVRKHVRVIYVCYRRLWER